MHSMLYGNGNYLNTILPAVSQYYIDKLTEYAKIMVGAEEWGEKFGCYIDDVDDRVMPHSNGIIILFNGNICPVYKDKIYPLYNLRASIETSKSSDRALPHVVIHRKNANEFDGRYDLLLNAAMHYNNELIEKSKLDSESSESWNLRNLIVAYHAFDEKW